MDRHKITIEVVDILYAIALGAGFSIGVYDFKERLLTLEVLQSAEAAQGFVRVLLGFAVIMASWLHYKTYMPVARSYPAVEVLIDIIIVLVYMSLFIVPEAPVAYYGVLTFIWVLYFLAKLGHGYFRPWALMLGLIFPVLFGLLTWSAIMHTEIWMEWVRLVAACVLVIMYRPLDIWILKHNG